MIKREDFEIWNFTRNGVKFFAFKVDYFGRYYAKSEEEILRKVEAVKERVAARLKWVEEENQRYYKRLAKQIEFRIKKPAKL